MGDDLIFSGSDVTIGDVSKEDFFKLVWNKELSLEELRKELESQIESWRNKFNKRIEKHNTKIEKLMQELRAKQDEAGLLNSKLLEFSGKIDLIEKDLIESRKLNNYYSKELKWKKNKIYYLKEDIIRIKKSKIVRVREDISPYLKEIEKLKEANKKLEKDIERLTNSNLTVFSKSNKLKQELKEKARENKNIHGKLSKEMEEKQKIKKNINRKDFLNEENIKLRKEIQILESQIKEESFKKLYYEFKEKYKNLQIDMFVTASKLTKELEGKYEGNQFLDSIENFGNAVQDWIDILKTEDRKESLDKIKEYEKKWK